MKKKYLINILQMKIELKNFRHHRNFKLTIPDKGLILLSGESGIGKTTILSAISYALFGQIKKPYSHGTNTCSVKLIKQISESNEIIIHQLIFSQ